MLLKVLIVDDEPFVRQGLRELIEWESYRLCICGEAENGLAAIRMIKKFQPHIVITDIKMPGIDGLELIRRAVRELKTSARFIILSGYADFNYAKAAIRYNAKGYILKPVEEEELIDIINRVKNEINEELENEKESFASIKAIASETIKKLIQGDICSDNLTNSKKWLAINDDEDLYFIIIDIENVQHLYNKADSTDVQTVYADIEKAIYQAVGKDNSLNVYQEFAYRYGIVVNNSMLQNSSNSIKKLAEHIYQKVSEDGKLSVSIFIGSKVTKASDLKMAYDTCHEAMKYIYMNPGNNIIYFDEVKHVPFSYNLDDIGFFAGLQEAVENSRQEEIHYHVEKIFKELQNKNIAPEIIRAYIIKFELEIIRIVSELSGDTNEILKRNMIYDMKEKKMSSIKDGLIRFCNDSSSYCKVLKEKRSNGLMFDVEKYIKNNYKNDISLKSIAEVFYINSVYLGQLFKKNFGAYFNDYLNQLRIENAMKLLRRTDYKVYEVAQMVGYIDTNYFISKFEKYCSMTPSQYKKSCS